MELEQNTTYYCKFEDVDQFIEDLKLYNIIHNVCDGVTVFDHDDFKRVLNSYSTPVEAFHFYIHDDNTFSYDTCKHMNRKYIVKQYCGRKAKLKKILCIK